MYEVRANAAVPFLDGLSHTQKNELFHTTIQQINKQISLEAYWIQGIFQSIHSPVPLQAVLQLEWDSLPPWHLPTWWIDRTNNNINHLFIQLNNSNINNQMHSIFQQSRLYLLMLYSVLTFFVGFQIARILYYRYNKHSNLLTNDTATLFIN